MANKKLKRKVRPRYDRLVGCIAVIGFGVLWVVNLFSSTVEALPTTNTNNISKSVVSTTKEYIKTVDNVDVDKVKVDYKKDSKEVVVNLLMGTSYEYRVDVVNDSHTIALGLVNELSDKFGDDIEVCTFDVDLNVATTYEMIVKQITDFEIKNVNSTDWVSYSLADFKDESKVTKKW